jgi:hypothetical protein
MVRWKSANTCMIVMGFISQEVGICSLWSFMNLILCVVSSEFCEEMFDFYLPSLLQELFIYTSLKM